MLLGRRIRLSAATLKSLLFEGFWRTLQTAGDICCSATLTQLLLRVYRDKIRTSVVITAGTLVHQCSQVTLCVLGVARPLE